MVINANKNNKIVLLKSNEGKFENCLITGHCPVIRRTVCEYDGFWGKYQSATACLRQLDARQYVTCYEVISQATMHALFRCAVQNGFRVPLMWSTACWPHFLHCLWRVMLFGNNMHEIN